MQTDIPLFGVQSHTATSFLGQDCDDVSFQQAQVCVERVMRERTRVYIRLVAIEYRFCTGQVLHHDGVMHDALVQEYHLLAFQNVLLRFAAKPVLCRPH